MAVRGASSGFIRIPTLNGARALADPHGGGGSLEQPSPTVSMVAVSAPPVLAPSAFRLRISTLDGCPWPGSRLDESGLGGCAIPGFRFHGTDCAGVEDPTVGTRPASSRRATNAPADASGPAKDGTTVSPNDPWPGRSPLRRLDSALAGCIHTM